MVRHGVYAYLLKLFGDPGEYAKQYSIIGGRRFKSRLGRGTKPNIIVIMFVEFVVFSKGLSHQAPSIH